MADLGQAYQENEPASARFQQAITKIAIGIRDSRGASRGVQLRRAFGRFTSTTWHHMFYFWNFASRVGSEIAEPVSEIILGAFAGELREEDVKPGLILAGQLKRWESSVPTREAIECTEDAEQSLAPRRRALPLMRLELRPSSIRKQRDVQITTFKTFLRATRFALANAKLKDKGLEKALRSPFLTRHESEKGADSTQSKSLCQNFSI